MSATVAPRPRLASALLQLVRLQLVRFGLVGATNTALTLAAYTALVALDVPVALAAAAGWGVGALNGFLLNRAWTFPAPPAAATRRRATPRSRCSARRSTPPSSPPWCRSSTCRGSPASLLSFPR
jgi:hypothetical protein